MRGIANVDIFGTVVRRKNDNGIIAQIQLVEFIHQSANMAIHIGDNRIVNPQCSFVFVFQAIRRELLVGFHLFFCGIENRMGIVEPCLNKKRLVFIALNKTNCFINNHLCRAAAALASLQIGKIEQRAIAHIDFTLVNAVIIRRGRALAATEMPLAKVSHRVPALLQQTSNCNRIGIEKIGHTPCRVLLVLCKMPVYAPVCRKTPGHNSGAAWGTNPRTNVELRKKCPLRGEAIQIWCFGMRMPVTTQIAPAPVIGEYKNNIWSAHREFLSQNQKNGKNSDPHTGNSGASEAFFPVEMGKEIIHYNNTTSQCRKKKCAWQLA